ncbi:MAG: hypothetical protein COC10_13500 [Sphingobium sp.]|nr:MAG: hypothetical protein COC10_13500 [Sphingobium sp.]
MNIREAKLNGIRAASEIHHNLKIDTHIKEGLESVDVFEALHRLNIPTICRPLEGLLGAFLNNGEQQGILVTTNRRLPIQRFTAAHELGHYWLGHEQSLDTEETVQLARSAKNLAEIQEIEAEAFASEFLLPKSLLTKTAIRHNWKKADFKKPDIVYQLALRTGTSYEATWRALLENNFIDNQSAEHLSLTPPKSSKKVILQGKTLTDSWADVLHLRDKDNGAHFMASPDDIVLVELEEHSSSGYRWMGLPDNQQFKLISDENKSALTDVIGSITSRNIYFQAKGSINLSMREQRPWQPPNTALKSFEVKIDFFGKEHGLPRAARN